MLGSANGNNGLRQLSGSRYRDQKKSRLASSWGEESVRSSLGKQFVMLWRSCDRRDDDGDVTYLWRARLSQGRREWRPERPANRC